MEHLAIPVPANLRSVIRSLEWGQWEPHGSSPSDLCYPLFRTIVQPCDGTRDAPDNDASIEHERTHNEGGDAGEGDHTLPQF
jgi:hypothetical protein